MSRGVKTADKLYESTRKCQTITKRVNYSITTFARVNANMQLLWTTIN